MQFDIIYIPLWSYSNSALKPHQRDAIIIYIPLWSYSNGMLLALKTVKEGFTFHYGPIQMYLLTNSFNASE